MLIVLALLGCTLPSAAAQESPLDARLLNRCLNGTAKEVADLLEQGANPNAADPDGYTALHRTAGRDDDLQKMRLLIDHGANVNAVDACGRSVLTEAAGSRTPKAVKMLLDSGARPDGRALAQASWLDRLETVQILLAAGASPNAGIGAAARGGHLEIVRLLLDKGANVNAKSTTGGDSPLHNAACQGGLETVRLLLKAGADPNARDDEDATPLHRAIAGNHDIKCVKLLVQSGAKLDLPNNEGITPVRFAAICGDKEIYDWLMAGNGGKEPRVSWPDAQRQESKSTQELLASLFSEEKEERLAAQRALAARGAAIMPDVLKCVESHAGLEGRFLSLFAAMGPDAEAALPLLTSRLSEKEHVFLATIAIKQIKPGALAEASEETKQKMAAALYEAIVDPRTDEMAGFHAEQLVGMGKSAVPTILRLLQHEDSKYRFVAAQTLTCARFSDQQIEAELIKLAQRDAVHLVRESAARALGSFGEPSERAKAALFAIIKNPPQLNPNETDAQRLADRAAWCGIADVAAGSLARYGPSVIDDLVPLLSPLDAPTRLPGITALRCIGAPAAPQLIELLANKDQSLAISASVALGGMGPPAVPDLAKAVSTGSEQVIGHAAGALRRIGPGAKPALPNLLEAAGSENRSDVSRLAAARAALALDAPSSRESEALRSAIPVFIRILEKGTFEHQGSAAETLGAIGAPARDALPMLYNRLDPPDQKTDTGGLVRDYVQRAAQEAITKIEAALDSAKAP